MSKNPPSLLSTDQSGLSRDTGREGKGGREDMLGTVCCGEGSATAMAHSAGLSPLGSSRMQCSCHAAPSIYAWCGAHNRLGGVSAAAHPADWTTMEELDSTGTQSTTPRPRWGTTRPEPHAPTAGRWRGSAIVATLEMVRER